jgi:hypothetical protein
LIDNLLREPAQISLVAVVGISVMDNHLQVLVRPDSEVAAS